MSKRNTFASWFRNGRGTSPRGTRRPPRHPRWKPLLEQLEDRTLLSVVFDPTNGSLTVNGSGNDNFYLDQVSGSPGTIEIEDNGTVIYSGTESALTGGIQFNGLLDTETLTVDFSNGNPIPAGGVNFNGGGGPGSKELFLQHGVETADTYSPGPNPGQGTIALNAGDTTAHTAGGTITFENLPSGVSDTVPGPLVVNATPANSAINYSQFVHLGLVTVDNLDTDLFTNKTTLTLNGLSGDDTFNLNNPTTPTGLTGITVNGGGGTDTLNFTAVPATGTITYTRPSRLPAPNSTPSPAPPPPG